MDGINISQARARDLAHEEYRVFVDPETGCWVMVEGLSKRDLTYHIRRTGDVIETIPVGAFEMDTDGKY